MKILGISAFYHDSAAALVLDGEVVAAAQEERFTRKKHDAAFPEHAIEVLPRRGGVGPERHRRRRLLREADQTFVRLLKTYLRVGPRGSGRSPPPCRLDAREAVDPVRDRAAGSSASTPAAQGHVFTEHHESHAASRLLSRRRSRPAAILTFDGVGEWATSGDRRRPRQRVELLEEMRFPHSLGLLYSAFTYFCGFKVNSGEYKLMGLAPYGEPVYGDAILTDLIDLRPDGSFTVDLQPLRLPGRARRMTNQRFDELFGGPPRGPEPEIEQRQLRPGRVDPGRATEEIVLRMARHGPRSPASHGPCSPAAWRSTAWPTAAAARGAVRRDLGAARPPATPAAPSAPRCGRGTRCSANATYRPNGRTAHAGGYLGPAVTPTRWRPGSTPTAVPLRAAARHGGPVPPRGAVLADGDVVAVCRGAWSSAPARSGTARSWPTRGRRRCSRILNLRVKYRESFRPSPRRCWPTARGVVRHRRIDSPYMLFVAAGRAPTASRPADPAEPRPVARLDQRSGRPSPRSPTSTAPPASRPSREESQPGAAPPARGVRRDHRLPGRDQHVVQRPR